jgi:hypothetical protein
MKPDSEIVLKGEDASKFREMLFDLEAIEERDAFILGSSKSKDRVGKLTEDIGASPIHKTTE